MCGIVAIFNIREQSTELRDMALRMSRKLRHRGPDWSGIFSGGSAILAHERLSIVDPESGSQPLYAPDGKQVLAVVNFPPRQIADFMSEVLVLGTYSEGGVVLIAPDRLVKNGDKLG